MAFGTLNADTPIVVSGGTGFLGRHLVERLCRQHVPVTVISRDPDRVVVRAGVTVVSATASDLVSTLSDVGPVAMVHAAAMSAASVEPSAISEMIESNVGLGAKMLEACATVSGGASPARFVGIGSFWQGSTRGERVGPNSLYAATKSATEQVAHYFAHERGVSSTFLQLSDVYGPGDDRRRLLDLIADSVHADVDLELTAGEQVTSFVHVDDVVSAVVSVIEHPTTVEPHVRSYSVHGPKVAPLRSTIEQLEADLGVKFHLDWGAKPYRLNEVMNPAFLPGPPNWSPRIGLTDAFASLHPTAL